MGKFLTRITPNEYVTSVHQIDLDKLWSNGIRLLLSDLDNTLLPWNVPDVPKELADWFTRASQKGMQVCVISNNRGQRVAEFSQLTGIPGIGAAKKPKPDAFLNALKQFGMSPKQTAMIGDQLFTDIRGANALGIHSILVLPIHPREWWGTRMVRIIERFAMRMLVRRGLEIPKSS